MSIAESDPAPGRPMDATGTVVRATVSRVMRQHILGSRFIVALAILPVRGLSRTPSVSRLNGPHSLIWTPPGLPSRSWCDAVTRYRLRSYIRLPSTSHSNSPSIFIASMTSSAWPVLTSWPTSTKGLSPGCSHVRAPDSGHRPIIWWLAWSGQADWSVKATGTRIQAGCRCFRSV